MSDNLISEVESDGSGTAPTRRPPLLAVLAGTAVLGTVSSLAVAGVAFADRGHDWGYRGGRHWWGVGSLLLLLALIAATAAVTTLVVGRRAATAGPLAPPAGPPSPPAAPTGASAATSPLAGAETILAERLARGEISPDDYRASVAALRGVSTTDPAGPADAADPSS